MRSRPPTSNSSLQGGNDGVRLELTGQLQDPADAHLQRGHVAAVDRLEHRGAVDVALELAPLRAVISSGRSE